LSTIESVNSAVFSGKPGNSSLNLTEFERFLSLLLSFDKSTQTISKAEFRQLMREKISHLKSEQLLNLNFVEICISATVVQALKPEFFILNSVSEQLYSIYLKNYFAETFGEPEENKVVKQRQKRKNKRTKVERVEEKEECDLKPLLDSFDESSLKDKDTPDLKDEEKQAILKDFDVESPKLIENSKAQPEPKNDDKKLIGDEPLPLIKISSARSDKSSLLSKMKQDQLNRQLMKQDSNGMYSPNIPTGRPPLLSEEFSGPKQPKKLSESYIVKYQSQNFTGKNAKKDSTHQAPSPHPDNQSGLKDSQEILGPSQRKSYKAIQNQNDKDENGGQRATVQSEPAIDLIPGDNSQQDLKFYFGSPKARGSNRRRRPSSQSILKPSIKESDPELLPIAAIRENPASKDDTYSTEDNNFAFNRVKTEKSQPRKAFDNSSFNNKNFDLDEDSCPSLRNKDFQLDVDNTPKSPSQLVNFKQEVSCSQEISQVSSQMQGDIDDRLADKPKVPKLKKLVKEKSGKESIKPVSTIQTAQAKSLRMGRWSDMPDRFGNTSTKGFVNPPKNNFYSSNNEARDKNAQSNVAASGRRIFQNPTTATTKTLKRDFNPKDQDANQKTPLSNTATAKPKTTVIKEERTVVQIRKILTWNKETTEEEDKKDRNESTNDNNQDSQPPTVDPNPKPETSNNQPSSSVKQKEEIKTPTKPAIQPKKVIKLKASRWEQTSTQQNESESNDVSQNSEFNNIDSTHYMSNESKSAKEPQGYSRGYNIQQHNIFNRENQKKFPTLQKFPKGMFQRTDIQVTEFVDLPSSNLSKIAALNQRRFDNLFYQMIDNNVKNVIKDLETFSKKFEQPRQIIKDRIHKIVQQTFNHPAIYVSEYGSFATNLLTPYSDLDLAIRGCFFDSREQCVEMLNIISENLQLFPFIKKVNAILTAAIPVLKIEADPSVIYEETQTIGESIIVKVDIIVEQFEEFNASSTAMRTTEFTKNCNRYYKTFYQNVLTMKFALSCNGLSNTYKGKFIRRLECIRNVAPVFSIH